MSDTFFVMNNVNIDEQYNIVHRNVVLLSYTLIILMSHPSRTKLCFITSALRSEIVDRWMDKQILSCVCVFARVCDCVRVCVCVCVD